MVDLREYNKNLKNTFKFVCFHKAYMAYYLYEI